MNPSENVAAHTRVLKLVPPDTRLWRYDGVSFYDVKTGEEIGCCYGRMGTQERDELNVARLCAAVNATQGIPSESLESGCIRELVEAAKYAKVRTVNMEAKRRLEAAIAAMGELK